MTLAPLLPLWVTVPLVTAVLMVFAQPLALRRVIYLAVPSLSVIGAFILLYQHHSHAVIAEHVGGFARGIGISFASDAFSALMLAATGIIIIASAWFAISIGEDERNRFFPTLTLVLMAGVNGALLTADLFNLFVWIEVMLMPSYALLAITGTWRRIGVDRMFVVVNLLTSSVFLLGVIYIYGAVGEVNIAVLAGAAANEPQVGIAITVCLIALCVKAGVVPVHGWLPRAYPATSAAVMGLFSGLHTKVAIYAIYRIVSTIFIFDTPGQWIIVVVLCLTMLVGGFGSLGEQRIRGSLAFQMVCGVGYILIALMLAANTIDIEARAVALGAGIFYLIHHMLTMGSLILTSGAIEETYGSGRFDRLDGLQRREPLAAGIMAGGMLSLVGFPPFSGVLAKVGIAQSAATAGGALGWTVIAVIIISSLGALLSMMYVWRGVFWGPQMAMYRPIGAEKFQPVEDDLIINKKQLLPGAFLLLLSLAAFFGAGWLVDQTTRAGFSLLDISDYLRAVLNV